MTSINALPTSPYYQLSDPSAGPGGATSGAGADPATDALLQALSASSSDPTADTSSSDAYLLDLSPQAQQYLNGVSDPSATSDLLSGLGGTSATGDLLGNSSFTLTTAQQQQVSAILAKYKDAPYTQDTFNQIQNDLNSAGLGTSILSLEDQVKSFDPSQVLIDALNGTTPDSSSLGFGGGAANEQSKSSSYMQSIISQWQNISTTYQATAQNAATAPVGLTAGA